MFGRPRTTGLDRVKRPGDPPVERPHHERDAGPMATRTAYGYADVAAHIWTETGTEIRVLTGLPRSGGSTVNLDTSGELVAGLPKVWQVLGSGGDLDGDGLDDLIAPTTPRDRERVRDHAWHGHPDGGRVRRPRRHRGHLRRHRHDDPVDDDASADLQRQCPRADDRRRLRDVAWCAAQRERPVHREGDVYDRQPVAVRGLHVGGHRGPQLRDAANGGRHVPAPGRHETTGRSRARASFRRPTRPAFAQPGWVSSGHALQDEGFVFLSDGPNQVASYQWDTPLDYRNRTIAFRGRALGRRYGHSRTLRGHHGRVRHGRYRRPAGWWPDRWRRPASSASVAWAALRLPSTRSRTRVTPRATSSA